MPNKDIKQVVMEQKMVDLLLEVVTYLQGRPRLTSINPICKPQQKVDMAMCETCGTITGFTFPENGYGFPDTGYWIECRGCDAWRMFYRIHDGHIIRKNYHGN